jgi:hypothetical protein
MNSVWLAGICLLCWFVAALYGLYIAERRGQNRSLREIVGGGKET